MMKWKVVYDGIMYFIVPIGTVLDTSRKPDEPLVSAEDVIVGLERRELAFHIVKAHNDCIEKLASMLAENIRMVTGVGI